MSIKEHVPMIESLSILIPTFNDDCLSTVEALVEQAQHLDACRWEIIVAEDGSTDSEVLESNARIASIAGCRYLCRQENVGRSAIRNLLAREAQYDYLLFVDAGLSFPDAGFLRRYVSAPSADVVCGGVAVGGSHPGNLRFLYEQSSQSRFSAVQRQQDPYQHFRTTNFLIRKSVMLAHPLREDILTYGYEDVLLGKDLAASSAEILHIENALVYERFEDNAIYINKVEESLHTLYQFRDELQGYSSLLTAIGMLRKCHLLFVTNLCYRVFENQVKRNLTGHHPSLWLFKVYKLIYFSHIWVSGEKRCDLFLDECYFLVYLHNTEQDKKKDNLQSMFK